MTGPRYDLVPPVAGTEPPLLLTDEITPRWRDPDHWRWDKVLYALAIALSTGWLVAKALAST